MKKKVLVFGLILLMFGIVTGCASKEVAKDMPSEIINVSGAASLTEALQEIKIAYEKRSDDAIQFNFGGSGSLQKQIQEGAPCDLFISASVKNINALEAEGLIETSTRKNLLGNTLVLVASQEKAKEVEFDKLTKETISSIAIGEVETVPVGNYAKQSLITMGIWNNVQEKLIYGKDVKQVLEYVETGNADCGFVYKSDTRKMKSGMVVAEVPKSDHDPIVYPSALTRDGSSKEHVKKFYDFVQSPEATAIFENYGFSVE
ncbi:MAG: molybdate ABC transporter substrate-binding protein [Eubacteriaceae bacterium]